MFFQMLLLTSASLPVPVPLQVFKWLLKYMRKDFTYSLLLSSPSKPFKSNFTTVFQNTSLRWVD